MVFSEVVLSLGREGEGRRTHFWRLVSGENESGSVSRDPWYLEESQERIDTGEGARGPVSKGRRQEEKGEVATQVCSMSADVFLRHTAVLQRKTSSSHPCGVGLESPNLSAALLNLVACG